MRQYYLTDRETESFYELLEIKKNLITMKNTLDEQELKFFCEFIKSLNMKQTAEAMNISLRTAYRIHKRIKGVCENFLLS